MIVSQISRVSGNSWISTKYVLKPFGQKSLNSSLRLEILEQRAQSEVYFSFVES